MLKVLTAAEMREVDRLTTERYGIPSILLMENAAHAVARVITDKLGGSVKDKSILILCGKGNNGGDGAALARILAIHEASVTAILYGKSQHAKGDALTNFTSADKISESVDLDLTWIETEDAFDFSGQLEAVIEYSSSIDVMVDALFGSGLDRPMDDALSAALEQSWISLTYKEKLPLTVAVDVPSGLNADVSYEIGPYVRADLTVSFTSPKIANILPPASRINGELFVVPIGSPLELIAEQPSELYLTESSDVKHWLLRSEFSSNSYKNKRGHCLLVAGSENYSGAAVMCGNAAMRSGVGLVTLAVPGSCKTEVASRSLPEVIVTPIREGEDGNVSDDAFSEGAELLEKADAIAVGCGLSATDSGVEKLVREIVETRNTPVIVDAGALWFFNAPAGVPVDKDRPPLIFTPHEGEFMRLLGTDDKDAIKDRLASVREFSQKHNVILVFKGERVLIGEPGGKVVVNPTGNSGLGKAGNGDTLTGIIAGFVTQAWAMPREYSFYTPDVPAGEAKHHEVFEAVVAAVYVAGLAGDIAEKKFGKRVMTASDVRECLTDAFREIQPQE